MSIQSVKMLWPEELNLLLFDDERTVDRLLVRQWPALARRPLEQSKLSSSAPSNSVHGRWGQVLASTALEAREFSPMDLVEQEAGIEDVAAHQMARAFVMRSGSDLGRSEATDWWSERQLWEWNFARDAEIDLLLPQRIAEGVYDAEIDVLDVSVAWIACDPPRVQFFEGLCLASTGMISHPDLLADSIVANYSAAPGSGRRSDGRPPRS